MKISWIDLFALFPPNSDIENYEQEIELLEHRLELHRLPSEVQLQSCTGKNEIDSFGIRTYIKKANIKALTRMIK
jgi:hypothetical protein